MNRAERFSPEHLAQAKGRGIAGRPAFECISLLLQGGGALGAYQAGVYQALAEENRHPDWVAGISIGAINAALIAGNPPETRVDKLRRFWEGITSAPAWDWSAHPHLAMAHAIDGRKIVNQMSAISARSKHSEKSTSSSATPASRSWRRSMSSSFPNGKSSSPSTWTERSSRRARRCGRCTSRGLAAASSTWARCIPRRPRCSRGPTSPPSTA